MYTSEFADEYGDWLDGSREARRARWLDLSLGEMRHATPVCVGPNACVRDVIARMNREHESAVLVTEPEARDPGREPTQGARVLGIFTERDVLTRVVAHPDALSRPLQEFMTPSPHVLPRATLLSAALRTLALGSYHHLPVVDDGGRPIGLVSLQTIIAFLAEAFPLEIMNAPPERESYPAERDGA
jgi:CBS domain-containing protein